MRFMLVILLCLCFSVVSEAKAVEVVYVELTAYYLSVKTCDKTPYITATNLDLRKIGVKRFNRIVAVSREAEKLFPLGSFIWIEGELKEVQDRMSKRIKGVAIDLLMRTKKEALEFGRRKGYMIIKR